MQYFRPSDIRTVACTVQNVTRAGSAFAIDQDEESVYIPAKLVEQAGVDVGDAVTCYCIDQFLDENRRHEVTARYRTIKLKIDQRFSDAIPGYVASELVKRPEPVEQPKPREITLEEARTVISKCLEKRKAWTAEQLVDEVKKADKEAALTDVMAERIRLWLAKLHNDGILANCKIRAQGSHEPIQYYAATTDIFIQLVDDYELDDEA